MLFILLPIQNSIQDKCQECNASHEWNGDESERDHINRTAGSGACDAENGFATEHKLQEVMIQRKQESDCGKSETYPVYTSHVYLFQERKSKYDHLRIQKYPLPPAQVAGRNLEDLREDQASDDASKREEKSDPNAVRSKKPFCFFWCNKGSNYSCYGSSESRKNNNTYDVREEE